MAGLSAAAAEPERRLRVEPEPEAAAAAAAAALRVDMLGALRGLRAKVEELGHWTCAPKIVLGRQMVLERQCGWLSRR